MAKRRGGRVGARGARVGLASLVFGVALGLAVAACGDDDGGGAGGSGATGTAATAQGGSAASGATGGSGGGTTVAGGAPGGGTSSGGGGAGGGTGGDGGAPSGLIDVGSLVVLGDSIGDGGGVGPYYYNLLRQALEAKYGSLAYHNEAESGSKTGALVGQIDDLPNTLPGPVVVAITSGGNDMKDVILQIVAGLDGPDRLAMGANIDAALATLLSPGRFGAGVAVHVFEATIYDASDGQGNYGDFDCNFSFPVALPTDGYFANWNGEIASRVLAQGQTVAEVHAHFYGHGFNSPPSWYHTDCTHPNALGHDQLRRLFYWHITGEQLP